MGWLLVLACAGREPTTWYVNAEIEEPGAGDDWETALATLDEALAGAIDGDEVLLAAGTYVPAGRGFVVPAGVTLRGGYDGDPESTAEPMPGLTVLSCDVAGDDEGGFGARDDNCGPVVEAGARVELHALDLEGGESSEAGGGLRASGGPLVLADVSLRENRSEGDGGGLWASGAEITATALALEDNAGDSGGGLALLGGGLTGDQLRLTRNSSEGDGGGLMAEDAFVMLDSLQSDQNQATGRGGGLHLVGGEVTIGTMAIVENSAGDAGGGGYLDKPSLDVGVVEVRGNSAAGDGGGLAAVGVLDALDAVTLVDNSSLGQGGGAWLDATTLSVVGSHLEGNTAAQGGGALHAPFAASIELVDSTFSSNSSAAAGGVLSLVDQDLRIEGCGFEDNRSDVDGEDGGGVLKIEGGALAVSASDFVGNATVVNGGVINAVDTEVLFEGSSFAGNTAEVSNGGVIEIRGGSLEVEGCSFVGNHGDDEAGALKLRSGGSLRVTASVFEANTARAGSAIHTYDADVLIEDTTFAAHASEDGTIYTAGDGETVARNCSFLDDIGAEAGVSIDSYRPFLTVVGTSFSGASGGTSIQFKDDNASIENTAFWSAEGQLAWSEDRSVSAQAVCAAGPAGDWLVELLEDPFVRTDRDGDGLDEVYLAHAGLDGVEVTTPCVDAGLEDAASEVDWGSMTTRTDGAVDTAPVDIGRHETP